MHKLIQHACGKDAPLPPPSQTSAIRPGRNGVNDNGAILPSVTGIRWPTSAFLFFIFFQADKVTQNVNG